MGYNQSDKDLVLRHLKGVKTVLDYGSQVDYSVPLTDKPLYISEWYESMGIHYDCIDLAGDNGAYKLNLAYELFVFPDVIDLPRQFYLQYDLTVDGGSKEHYCQAQSYPVTEFHNGEIKSVYPKNVTDALLGYYWGWRNQFELTKKGGKIICVNPKSGFWPSHGYHYLNMDFYERLCELSDLQIVELYEHPACNNWETGMNVVAVLHKTGDMFPNYEEFSKLPIYNQ